MLQLPDISKGTPSESRTASESLLPGVYTIANRHDPHYVLDLSGQDRSSVLAFKAHQGDNQKWQFDCLGPGYSIRSLWNGGYITPAILERSLVSSEYPVSWAVEAVDTTDGGTFKIRWSNSSLALGMTDDGHHVVELNKIQTEKHAQEWRMIPVSLEMPTPWKWSSTPVTSTTAENTPAYPTKIPNSSTSTVIRLEDLKAYPGGSVSITTKTTVETVVKLL